MMHNQLRIQLGNHAKLALANLRRLARHDIWPELSRLAGDESDVLWAFFHFAGEVEGGGEDEVGICAADFDEGKVAP